MIRDFRPDDQPAVRQLVLAGLRERWGDAYDPGVNPDLDDIADTYIDAGADVVVVDERDEIVATGILMPEPGGRGRILRMSVSRSHRRKGHGRRVVDELVGRARRRAIIELLVSTDTPWTSAVALYRACGFAEVGSDERDTHFRMAL